MRVTLVATLLVLPASIALVGQVPEKPATFRTGVEVVTIDVGATDSSGRPVLDLRAPEFQVKVDGKLRQVVSAQLVFFDVEAAKRAAVAPVEDTFFTTNIGPPEGRMILIAVDQSSIRPGAVRQLLGTAARFVDSLSPLDQVGFVVYPPPGPEIGFTTNHLRVKEAMELVVGNQATFRGNYNIGISEAIAIHEGRDAMVTNRVVDRECGMASAIDDESCSRMVVAEAGRLNDHVRREATVSLQNLGLLLRKLAILDGQKSLVLMSEGLVLNQVGSGAEDIARLAAVARTSLNVLLMDVPRTDMVQSVLPTSPMQDRALQSSGLEELAAMTRGSLFRVLGTGQSAFDQLASNLSGYYLIGVEEEPSDRDTKRHRLDVQVRRRGVTLRSHRAFVLSSSVSQVRPPADSLLDALSSPFSVADIPLRVTNFAFQDAEMNTKVRVVIAAEVGQAGASAEEFTVGFILLDDQGRVAASGTEKRTLTPVDGRPNTPLEYLAAAIVDPGSYVLRFGVVDSQGRRGSVVRDVRAWKTTDQMFAVGDRMVGNPRVDTGPARPQLEPRIHEHLVSAYLELYASERANLFNTGVSIELAEDQDGPTLVSAPAQYVNGPIATTVAALADVPTDVLPPGRYVARARITRDGKLVGLLARPFLIEADLGAPPPETSGSPTYLAEWVPGFERDAVLSPEVVGAMLDLAEGDAPSLADAMAEARAGRYGVAALEALTVGDQAAAAFLKGLDFFMKGQLDAAANQFSTASGPSREYFPAAFYLGACYAAAGRDEEAAGTWQLAIGTAVRPGVVYTLFADARLRTGQPASVVDVLQPVHRRIATDDGLEKRLAMAYVMTGRHEEALPLLDDYLVRHASDQAVLYAAVLARYNISSRADVPLSDAERAKVVGYVRAYTGPQRALLTRYLAALTP